MRRVYLTVCAIVATILLSFGTQALAVTIGQQDVFDGPGTDNWSGGSSPTHIASGGPGGAADGYLQIASTNFNLGAKNTGQWKGDYVSDGVTALSMDLINFGDEVVEFRLLIQGPGGTFTSTDSVVLPASSGWQPALFGLTTDTLTYTFGGTGVLADTLGGATRLLVRHDSEGPSAPGVFHIITTTMGIDNITATVVPEPSSLALLCSSLLLLVPRRRR